MSCGISAIKHHRQDVGWCVENVRSQRAVAEQRGVDGWHSPLCGVRWWRPAGSAPGRRARWAQRARRPEATSSRCPASTWSTSFSSCRWLLPWRTSRYARRPRRVATKNSGAGQVLPQRRSPTAGRCPAERRPGVLPPRLDGYPSHAGRHQKHGDVLLPVRSRAAEVTRRLSGCFPTGAHCARSFHSALTLRADTGATDPKSWRHIEWSHLGGLLDFWILFK